MLTAIDILNSASTDYASTVIEPDDWNNAVVHASDVSACVRAVWYRRRQKMQPDLAPVPFDAKTRMLFARGRGIESELGKHLTWAFGTRGYFCHEQLSLAFQFEGPVLTVRYVRDETPLPYEGVCHIDFAAVNVETKEAIVVECKSVGFLPKEPYAEHVLQASTYAMLVALRIGAEFRVHTVLRYISAVNGESVDFPVEWFLKEAIVRDRLHTLLATTGPAAPIPEAKPPEEAFVLEPERTAIGAKSRAKDAALVLVNQYCDSRCDYAQCERYRANAAAQDVA